MNHLLRKPSGLRPAKAESPRSRGSILIVESDAASRDEFVQIVAAEDDLRVCGSVASSKAAARLADQLSPDLVLIGDSQQGETGIRSVKQLRACYPHTKLLVLSMKHEASHAERLLQAGADGFTTGEELDLLTDAIRDVLGGFLYVSEAVAGSPEARARQHAGSAENGRRENHGPAARHGCRRLVAA